MKLDAAIDQMQFEVDSFKQGTKAQPAEGSTEWLLYRAKLVGLSMLKQMRADELSTTDELQRRYSAILKVVKSDEPG